MSLFQEPEPFEFTILDELISNLTFSDEESLGMCKCVRSLLFSSALTATNGPLTVRDDDSDEYWTADDDEPSPPRLRTASLRVSNGTFSNLHPPHTLTNDSYDRSASFFIPPSYLRSLARAALGSPLATISYGQ